MAAAARSPREPLARTKRAVAGPHAPQPDGGQEVETATAPAGQAPFT
jgi:hypothetical protein